MIIYDALFIFAQQMLAFWNIFKLIVHLICKKNKEQEKSSKIKENDKITSAVNANQKKISSDLKKISNHNSQYACNNFIQKERAADPSRRAYQRRARLLPHYEKKFNQ